MSNSTAWKAYLFHFDVGFLESFQHVQDLVDGHGGVGRLVEDLLEVGVGLILHLLGELLRHLWEDAGHVSAGSCNPVPSLGYRSSAISHRQRQTKSSRHQEIAKTLRAVGSLASQPAFLAAHK